MKLQQPWATSASETPVGCARLHVVMYHYVRDFARSRFPRIKGLEASAFAAQLDSLAEKYEMASLESALAYLAGDYVPLRDLCLLTFDDGLREHYELVTPELRSRGIQGLFFVITGALDEGRVAAVHKNHFLMAALEFVDYRTRLLHYLATSFPQVDVEVPLERARAVYRWDTPEAASLKFLLNFQLPPHVRDSALDSLFQLQFGDEPSFAAELYLNWSEAQAMQADGMVIGGHTHLHQALASLKEADQESDFATCSQLLRARLRPQLHWPFSYPYGKPREAYTEYTVQCAERFGFSCAFSTAVGSNDRDARRFELRRIDTKDVS